MKIRQGLTFDDVLLVPQHSNIRSRNLISLDVDLGKNIKLQAPIISANMTNVTEVEMATAIANFGGLPILHRFATLEHQVEMLKASNFNNTGCSIGVNKDDYKRACTLVGAGCSVLCIDVAHGDHYLSLKTIEKIASGLPGILLIAGNVATAGGARRLYNAGAHVIKVGIGPGSLCTTRIETGNGVPQMTALYDVFQESCMVPVPKNWDGHIEQGHIIDPENRKFKIIADGGLRSAGDCVKALCYSDAVMLGSMLAGTDEAPGNIVKDIGTGKRFKEYAGSSTHKANRVEGVVRHVPCKGPVKQILTKISEGIQSGLSYQGCINLKELKENPEFIQLSSAGLIESHPHSV